MTAAPKESTAPKATSGASIHRFPLLRRVMRFYRALLLTLLTGLLGAVLLVPLLRDPTHYLAGLHGEWAFVVALATQDPTQTAAAAIIVVALFALSWLSDHAYQREVQINPLSAAPIAPLTLAAGPIAAPIAAPTPPPLVALPAAATAPTQDHAFIPRVFISHAGADHAFCVRLAHDLRAALGGDPDGVYYDRDPQDGQGGLAGGQHYPEALAQEIAERNVFVVILSPEGSRPIGSSGKSIMASSPAWTPPAAPSSSPCSTVPASRRKR